MASGSYYAKKDDAHGPTTTQIPRRATRHLPEAEDEERTEIIKAPPAVAPGRWGRPGRVIDECDEHPLTRYIPWLRPLLICTVVGVVALLVLISAGVLQRPSAPQLLTSSSGQVYPIQVGGTLGTINAWTNSKGPSTPTVRISQHLGPYSVVGKNSLAVAFMNRVLAYYHSPAAGMAQDLYNDGAKYGLDSAYALAFFMHESSFGTTGVARVTLSLSNMRCVPEYPCYNYNGGYAQFSSWEQGFEAWFKLIRNLYVNIWGRATIDQIIPKYAPNSDGNDEAAYIASLKHTIDAWRAGTIPI